LRIYNLNMDNISREPSPETKIDSISIREARAEDIDSLRYILGIWVRNPETHEPIKDEIEGVLDSILENTKPPKKKHYYVALGSEGEILGMMGFASPSIEMVEYTTSDNSIEFINAYVDSKKRGLGVGKILASYLEQEAKLMGYKEIIVNSGPRYAKTGWSFWNSLYGEPVAISKDLYGPGLDAPVWRKSIGLNN